MEYLGSNDQRHDVFASGSGAIEAVVDGSTLSGQSEGELGAGVLHYPPGFKGKSGDQFSGAFEGFCTRHGPTCRLPRVEVDMELSASDRFAAIDVIQINSGPAAKQSSSTKMRCVQGLS